MNENETVAQDTERLEELDQEIKDARQHLEGTISEDRPEFYQDDESRPEESAPDEAAPPRELPG